MKPLKVKAITKLRNDKVYDIKHLLDSKHFLSDHPNLIVNDLIISNCSRHAGGVVIAEDLDYHMPLISSKDVRQTPWSEGQNVRHLEPMGFIKFDLLGLSTLRMIEGAISHILRRRHNIENPTFNEILDFYNKNLHPDVIDLNDQKVYKNVFQKGNWCGTFQFTECLTGDTKVLMADGKTKRLDKVKPGDLVVSYNEDSKNFEPKEVLNFLNQGEKETYTITMENGEKIRATADHEFLTKEGWKKLKDLSTEDEIISY